MARPVVEESASADLSDRATGNGDEQELMHGVAPPWLGSFERNHPHAHAFIIERPFEDFCEAAHTESVASLKALLSPSAAVRGCYFRRVRWSRSASDSPVSLSCRSPQRKSCSEHRAWRKCMLAHRALGGGTTQSPSSVPRNESDAARSAGPLARGCKAVMEPTCQRWRRSYR